MDDQHKPDDEQPATGDGPGDSATPAPPPDESATPPPDAAPPEPPAPPTSEPADAEREITPWEAVEAADRAKAAARPPVLGRRLGVVSVVTRSLDILIAHPLPFVAIHLPTLFIGLLGSLAYTAPTTLTRPPDPLAIIAVAIFAIVLSQVIGLATMILADDFRAGRPEALGSVIQRALGRTPAAIGLILLLYVILIGLLIVVAIPFAIAVTAQSGILIFLAGLVVFVVFVVVIVRWSLATAAVGLEGAGPLDALGRSLALTRGNSWRLVGVFALLVLLIGPLSAGLSTLALLTDSVLLRVVVPGLVGLFTGPLASIAIATILGDLTDRPIAPDSSGRDPRPRRQIVVGATVLAGVIALAVALPTFGTAISRYSFQGAPADRGTLLFGTARNPVDACRPQATKTTFSTSEAIHVGGYFTAPLMPGQTGTVEIYRDGDLLNSGPLSAARPVACYYEINPLRGALPGTYRLLVRIDNRILAEGTFVVQ